MSVAEDNICLAMVFNMYVHIKVYLSMIYYDKAVIILTRLSNWENM